MTIYTYTEETALVSTYVGRVATDPQTQRPVLLLDLEGRYAAVDLGTGMATWLTPADLRALPTWTWHPKLRCEVMETLPTLDLETPGTLIHHDFSKVH